MTTTAVRQHTTREQALALAQRANVSEKQFNFIERLVRERTDDFWPSEPEARVQRLYELFRRGELDRHKTSREIDYWLSRPQAQVDLTPGVYEVDGRVYVVKPNKEKTALYAKRLVELNGARRVNEENDTVRFELEYAPGAIRDIRPEHRMPLKRAEELTIRYGRCISCGRPLKAAVSVRRGIGPVCVKMFGNYDEGR